MLNTLINAFKEKEIRNKMLLTLLMLLIFRLGCFIPVPGIASGSFQSLSSNDFFSIMSTITGGSLQNGTLFALGIIPFINAFIIMQLLTLIIPPLDKLSKSGEEGRKKITQITRYMAILLAVIQGVGICLGWGKGMFDETFGSTSLSMALVIIMFVGGSCLVMWIADRITEYGIGNGTSLIIFVGILASAGQSLLSALTKVGGGDVAKNVWLIIAFLVVVLFVFVFIIFVDLAERKIAVKYSQQVKGRKLYGGQTTYIPMKVNAGGVMPIIFASSFLMFPQMIASFWPQSAFYQWWSQYLGIGTPVYIVVMSLLILFFAFFYSQIQFNPEDIARNLQQNGATLQQPEIRPGKPTELYLKKINNRITLFGAIFLAILSLVPSIVFKFIGSENGLANAFSATGLLIVVSVAMEFDTQLQNQLMMRQYRGKGFLK